MRAFVLKKKKGLDTHYGHYSGIVVDIFYDHFLPKNWSMYTHLDLKEFTQYFYTILQTNYSIVPSKIQHMLPYMIKEDWLYNYQFLEGIQQVMYGMERRIKFRKKLSESVRELHLHYEDFNQEFIEFFPQLEVFTAFEKEKLINR